MSTVGTLYDETIRNGMMTLLATNVAANSAALDFGPATFDTSKYISFVFDIARIIPSVAAQHLMMLVSGDGGANWQRANYDYYSFLDLWSSASGAGYTYYGAGGSGWGAQFYIAFSIDTNGVSGRVKAQGLNITHRQFLWDCHSYEVGSLYTRSCIGGGIYAASLAINAIRFVPTSGLLSSGAIRLYGLADGALK